MILKLQGIPIAAIKEPISAGLLPFIANQAGIAKKVIPSGIPCAAYSEEKVKYRNRAFSDKANLLLFLEELFLKKEGLVEVLFIIFSLK